MKTSLKAFIAATCIGTGIATVPLTGVASASVPANYCNGKSQNTVVKVYYRADRQYPLRCGTATWGFNHINYRWSASFDSQIALAVGQGTPVGASKFIYYYTCTYNFTVYFNMGALNGNGVTPQGIISAYDPLTSAATPQTGCQPI